MKHKRFTLLLLLLISPTLFASTNWSDLPKDSQRLLGKMEQQWPQLQENRRQQLLSLSKKWLTLPNEKRNTLWKRFQRWQSLPVAKQQLMQKNYQRFKNLPAGERQQLLQSHQRFHNMETEQQQQMMQRFQQFQQFQQRNKHHPGGGMNSSMGKMKMDNIMGNTDTVGIWPQLQQRQPTHVTKQHSTKQQFHRASPWPTSGALRSVANTQSQWCSECCPLRSSRF